MLYCCISCHLIQHFSSVDHWQKHALHWAVINHGTTGYLSANGALRNLYNPAYTNIHLQNNLSDKVVSVTNRVVRSLSVLHSVNMVKAPFQEHGFEYLPSQILTKFCTLWYYVTHTTAQWITDGKCWIGCSCTTETYDECIVHECEWYQSLTAHQPQKAHTVPKQV